MLIKMSVKIELDALQHEIDEINEKVLTFGEFVKSKAGDMFEDNIPIEDIKEIPNPFWKLTLGIVSCGLMLIVFLYFVVISK